MYRFAVTLGVLAVLFVGADAGGPSANCGALSHSYASTFFFIRTQNAFPQITQEFGGAWWSLGFGDPAPGAGIDNGLYPSGDLQFYGGGCDYGNGCWLYAVPFYWYYYGVGISGDWTDPRVDGCIDDTPGPDCMAVLLDDQASGKGFFGLFTDLEDASGNFSFPVSFNETLAEVPAPVIWGVQDSGGVLTVSLAPPVVPSAGLKVSAGTCDTGLVEGYKIYQQVSAPGDPSPGDRRRDGSSSSWQIALGGAAAGGGPRPPGVASQIHATDCVDGGSLFLTTSFVFDSGFETRFVSRNSTEIPCGTCQSVDQDNDGARSDKCVSRDRFDCNDSDPAVFPGAEQICDGINNDCRHPDWPALGDSEGDLDGDGVTVCGGDPCPQDPLDDADGDGFCANLDNCPVTSNPSQADADGDGAGDACDPCPASEFDDVDGDALCGEVDNCPQTYNPGQADLDFDGIGDVCDVCPNDPDVDGDGICETDPCPLDPDNDIDGDGICGDVDICPLDPANDIDGDGLCGDVDNCPVDSNPGQADGDGDLLGDACDIFAPPVTLTSALDDSAKVTTGDIDGDGDLDILSFGRSSTSGLSRVDWYENLSGDGTSWTARTVFPGPVWSSVAAADFDRDGDGDVLQGGLSQITWSENLAGDGSQWNLHSVGGDSSFAVLPADIDGDGDPDVVAQQQVGPNDYQVQWLENSGSGTGWAAHTIGGTGSVRLDALAVGDVDGDGKLDVFAGIGSLSFNTGRIFLYKNPGGGPNWSEQEILVTSGLVYTEFATADMDGDGDIDFVLSGTSRGGPGFNTGRVAWYENGTGQGSGWTEHVIHSDYLDYESVAAIDVDGDGDTDAVTGNSSPERLSWHENVLGDGSSWKLRTIVSIEPGPVRAASADIDGDGLPDAVGASRGRVAWHENILASSPGPTADAGPDRTIECADSRGAPATLDGSGSSDPPGGPLTYTWTGPFPTVSSADPTVMVTIPPGTHVVQLTVENDLGLIDSDTATISVVEPATASPDLLMLPGALWPPNHRMVDVTSVITGTCGLDAVLLSVASSEPDDASGGGDGSTTDDIQGAQAGSRDLSFQLRAERDGGGGGRIYTVVYQVPDGSGGWQTLTAFVEVPGNMGVGAEPMDISLEQRPAGTFLSWPNVPNTHSYNVIRGDLGALTVIAVGDILLGEAACLQSGSSTPHTNGTEDPLNPPPGAAFFYAVEYDDGLPSSYGTVTATGPRIVTSGGCGETAP